MGHAERNKGSAYRITTLYSEQRAPSGYTRFFPPFPPVRFHRGSRKVVAVFPVTNFDVYRIYRVTRRVKHFRDFINLAVVIMPQALPIMRY